MIKRILRISTAVIIMFGAIFVACYYGVWGFLIRPVVDIMESDLTSVSSVYYISEFFKLCGKEFLGIAIVLYSFIVFKFAKFFMIDEYKEDINDSDVKITEEE